MGYDIRDASGFGIAGTSGGGDSDNWTFTLDLRTGATTVSGNFNAYTLLSSGEANSYVFSSLSSTNWGTLTYNASNGQFTFTANTQALYDSDSNHTVSFTVTGTSGSSSDTDHVNIRLLICFAAGTLIETAEGRRPVEEIVAGDLVRTASGGHRPVLWAGSRHVSAREMAANPGLRPVRIRRGGLGGALPHRDLVVSPQHRVLLTGWRAQLLYGEPEVLVPAKALVDGRRVSFDPVQSVDYHHLLLDTHDILLSEGAPTESFLASDYAMSALGVVAQSELERLLLSGSADGRRPARPVVTVREASVLAVSA